MNKKLIVLFLLSISSLAYAEVVATYTLNQKQVIEIVNNGDNFQSIYLHGRTNDQSTVVVHPVFCNTGVFKHGSPKSTELSLVISQNTGINFAYSEKISKSYGADEAKCVRELSLLKSATPSNPIVVDINDDGSFDVKRLQRGKK